MTQHESNAEIGDRLRRARERAGLRQAQLGAMVERSRYHVWRIENHKLNPDAVMIARLANALGIEPEELTEDVAA